MAGRGFSTVVGIVVAGALVACARLGGTPPPSAGIATPASAPIASASATPSPSRTSDALVDHDLQALRDALLGPSPVPSGWAAEVDELIAEVEAALASAEVPTMEGQSAEDAACSTWQPLVGHLDWATGAFVERRVLLAHLAQLTAVAPDAIREPAAAALEVVSAAAAAQLTPDGDAAAISRAPRDEFRAIGSWALEHCELEVVADAPPDTEGWTDDEVQYSCDLDRDLLARAQGEFRDGPGEGRFATHPHELEIALEFFVYPAWHRITSVDNEATPPTADVEPIPGSFCDR
jgi:hypothetical protein